MEESGDGRRRNPPQLPSTYVTLVQLRQRRLQEEEQRKQREKQEREEEQEREEQRKQREKQEREEEQERERERERQKKQKEEEEEEAEDMRKRQQRHQQQQQIESLPNAPRWNHRPVHFQRNRSIPCEKSCSSPIGWKPPGESSRFGAIVVKEDGESREGEDDSKRKWREKKKNNSGGKPRDVEEEEAIGCTEQLEKEKIHVVGSSGRECEKEGNGGKCEGNASLFPKGMKKNNRKNKKKRVEQKHLTNGKEQEVLPKKENVEAENGEVMVSSGRDREKEENGQKREGNGGKRGNQGLFLKGMRVNGGNNGKKRVEDEDLNIGTEQEVLPKKENVEAENGEVIVSSGRDREKEENGQKREGNGGKRGNQGLFLKGMRVNRGNNGKKRVEVLEDEDLNVGTEQEVLPKKENVEAENGEVMVSSGRDRENEENGQKREGNGGKRGNQGLFLKGMRVNQGNNGKKRVEDEDLNIGTEQEVLPKRANVEDENVAVVVSTKRDYKNEENERKCEGSGGRRGNARLFPKGMKKDERNNTGKMAGLLEGNGKNLVVNGGRVWEKRVVGAVLDHSERVLGNFEGLSVRGGYERNPGNVNCGPRTMDGWGNSRRLLQSPKDSNLVWIRKEEGDTSDANVAGV